MNMRKTKENDLVFENYIRVMYESIKDHKSTSQAQLDPITLMKVKLIARGGEIETGTDEWAEVINIIFGTDLDITEWETKGQYIIDEDELRRAMSWLEDHGIEIV